MKSIINKPPKLSKISQEALLKLDDDQFSELKQIVIKRNKMKFQSRVAKKLGRKLLFKRFPNKRREHIFHEKSKIYDMFRRYKYSDILDFFNSRRASLWKQGKDRTKSLTESIEIQNFSFIDYPNETLELFYKFAEYEPYLLDARANFIDEHIADISPYLLWGIIKKEMYPYIKGGDIHSRVSNVLKGLDLNKFMQMSFTYADDRNIIALPPIWKPQRDLIEGQKITTLEVGATNLVNKINEWLCRLYPPMGLSEEGQRYVTSFVVEILENAQRHSIRDAEGNWYMTAFMEFRNNQYFCCLAFINTGMPIYDSIFETDNPEVKKELLYYISSHKSINSNVLSTVYALQDGSTRQNYKDSRGGVGMMRMVKFINEIGDTEIEDYKPQISIITGNVCIHFDKKYRNAVKLDDHRNYQWFNEYQDRKYAPEREYAFILKKTFPGTIITTRFCLDAESLIKKAKNDENH